MIDSDKITKVLIILVINTDYNNFYVWHANRIMLFEMKGK